MPRLSPTLVTHIEKSLTATEEDIEEEFDMTRISRTLQVHYAKDEREIEENEMTIEREEEVRGTIERSIEDTEVW